MKSKKKTSRKASPKARTKPKATTATKIKRADPKQAQQRMSKVPKRSHLKGMMERERGMAKSLTLPDGRVFESVNMMARGVGVGAGHLSRVMNGKRNVSLHLAHRWAGFLGVSLDILYAILYGPNGIVPKPIVNPLAPVH